MLMSQDLSVRSRHASISQPIRDPVRSRAVDIPSCYWDFATDFGIDDAIANGWNESLRAALLQS